MTHAFRWLRLLPLLCVLWTALPASAADVARGQTLYTTFCSSCHNAGANPGPEFIRKGAGAPSIISFAFLTVMEMEGFAGALSSNDVGDIAAYLAVRFNVTPPPPVAAAVEYYHAAFDHFFVTAIADEITKLDNGTFKGWSRTGLQFEVFKAAGAGLSPVCRFFSNAFGDKSSHFYTASPAECTVVKSNPDWTFEGEVFFVATPSSDGACAAGLVPVFRLYNDGKGAAPNHRLTSEVGVQSEMRALGWIPEGYGVGVTMCVPAPPSE